MHFSFKTCVEQQFAGKNLLLCESFFISLIFFAGEKWGCNSIVLPIQWVHHSICITSLFSYTKFAIDKSIGGGVVHFHWHAGIDFSGYLCYFIRIIWNLRMFSEGNAITIIILIYYIGIYTFADFLEVVHLFPPLILHIIRINKIIWNIAELTKRGQHLHLYQNQKGKLLVPYSTKANAFCGLHSSFFPIFFLPNSQKAFAFVEYGTRSCLSGSDRGVIINVASRWMQMDQVLFHFDFFSVIFQQIISLILMTSNDSTNEGKWA